MMLSALTDASDKVYHLNLKPENVLVAADGSVKVTDFGLDEVVTVIPRGRSRAMSEQRRFLAPEQIRRSRNLTVGQDPIDNRADQYRWFHTGGSRWGMDDNEDTKIDYWKRISPQEVAEEARADALRTIARDRDPYETFVDAATAIHELAPTEPPHFPDKLL